jgi:hypothetical protein
MATEIRTLSATCSQGYPIEEFYIRLEVNQVARAEIAALPNGKGKVVPVTEASVLDEVKKINAARAQGQTAQDFELNVSSNGKSLTFKGYSVAPRYSVSRQGNVSFRLNGAGVDSIMDGLNLSIYRHSGATADAETSQELKPIPKETEGKIPNMLKKCTDVLLENFPLVVLNTSPPEIAELLTRQHELNQGDPINRWYELLKNSEVTFEKWAAIAAKHPVISSQIAEQATKMLQQSSSGFWSMLNGLMGSFLMYYVPSLDGTGKFQRLDKKMEVQASLGDFSPISADFMEGDRSMIPLGGVVMIAPGAKNTCTETNGGEMIAGHHPDPLNPGYAYRTTPPTWMLELSGVPVVGSTVDTEPPDPKTPNYSLPRLRSNMKTAKEFRKGVAKAGTSFLDELCKIIYKDKLYMSSQASFTVPLDLGLPYGVRVSGKFGDSNFEGFIESLEHRARIEGGRTLSATSTLTLTHITY